MRPSRNPLPRPRWLQPLRIAAFAAAISGLGTIVVAEAVAADVHEPIAEVLELETPEDAADLRLRFAGFAAIPEASPAPVVAIDEPKPQAKAKKKKKRRLLFGRLDAY